MNSFINQFYANYFAVTLGNTGAFSALLFKSQTITQSIKTLRSDIRKLTFHTKAPIDQPLVHKAKIIT